MTIQYLGPFTQLDQLSPIHRKHVQVEIAPLAPDEDFHAQVTRARMVLPGNTGIPAGAYRLQGDSNFQTYDYAVGEMVPANTELYGLKIVIAEEPGHPLGKAKWATA